MVDQAAFDQILNDIQHNTPRQFEVLERVLRGLSDREIADDLCVTPATVRKHVERLCHAFQLARAPRQSKRSALISLFAQHSPQQLYLSPAQPQPAPAQPRATPRSEHCVHNLPAADHTQLIGRETELERILTLLDPQHPATRISIEGPGGVGKTSLVLEGIRRYLAQPLDPKQLTYGAILFTSAQPQRLTLTGVLPKLRQDRTRQDMIRTLCRVLDRSHELVSLPEEEQLPFVQDLLRAQRSLLIVDNLESLRDREQILSFLYDLPAQTKVMITSRETAQLEGITLRLGALEAKESLALIHHQAEKKQVSLTPVAAAAIQARTGGLPAAIVYTLGQMAAGYGVEDVLEELIPATDLAQYCFGQSIAPLQGSPSHGLLLTLGLFPQSASRESLKQISTPVYTAPQIATGLAQLHHLSLCQLQDSRYRLMPLTQEYVLAELRSYPHLETQIRERWLHWAVQFVTDHSSADWREWHDHQVLDQEWETLREVVDWCMAQERLEEVYQLWHHLKGLSHACGYWQERLQWLEWLHHRAKLQGDWGKVAEALTYRGRTLALINHPHQWREALRCCQAAWDLRQYQTSSFQFDLMISITLLLIRLDRFEEAEVWLTRSEAELSPDLDRVQMERRQVYVIYYQARIALCQQEYGQARQLYQEAWRRAEAIPWQRAITYSRAWLGVVALRQGQWQEAEVLLEASLKQAEAHQDRRCIALCRGSYAHLEQQRGCPEQAQHWGELACQEFKRLNMIQELREMEALLSRS